jgi:Protein of unknown function (DUF5133)
MLMAHPTVLRDLVEQYEALVFLDAEAGDPEARQRMEDVSYTLCVSTGTRDIDTALTTARHQLSQERPGALASRSRHRGMVNAPLVMHGERSRSLSAGGSARSRSTIADRRVCRARACVGAGLRFPSGGCTVEVWQANRRAGRGKTFPPPESCPGVGWNLKEATHRG